MASAVLTQQQAVHCLPPSLSHVQCDIQSDKRGSTALHCPHSTQSATNDEQPHTLSASPCTALSTTPWSIRFKTTSKTQQQAGLSVSVQYKGKATRSVQSRMAQSSGAGGQALAHGLHPYREHAASWGRPPPPTPPHPFSMESRHPRQPWQPCRSCQSSTPVMAVMPSGLPAPAPAAGRPAT